jgi:1-pyrroline-5-carboxylate dehydrogenase
MGNVVLWKPASASVLSNYLIFKIYEEAGMPPGVIQFLPGPHTRLEPLFFH